MIIIVNIILIFFLSTPVLAESLPDGWRYPNDSDINGAWAQYKKELPEPYHVTSDFNGDGVLDHVWILIKKRNNDMGVFAFISSKGGQVKVVKVREQKTSQQHQQRLGLLLLEPGQTNKTSCGRGLSKCYRGGVVELKSESHMFEIFTFNESISSFYRWNDAINAFSEESIED